MKNFKFSVFGSRFRTLAMMIGSWMFVAGVKDFIPQLGSLGYIVGGVVLMWMSWRDEK
jgi:hypothetical protein